MTKTVLNKKGYLSLVAIKTVLNDSKKYEKFLSYLNKDKNLKRFVFFDGEERQKISIFKSTLEDEGVKIIESVNNNVFDLRIMQKPYSKSITKLKRFSHLYPVEAKVFGMFSLSYEYPTVKGIKTIDKTYRLQAVHPCYIDGQLVSDSYFHYVHQPECKYFPIEKITAPMASKIYSYISEKIEIGIGCVFFEEQDIYDYFLGKGYEFKRVLPSNEYEGMKGLGLVKGSPKSKYLRHDVLNNFRDTVGNLINIVTSSDNKTINTEDYINNYLEVRYLQKDWFKESKKALMGGKYKLIKSYSKEYIKAVIELMCNPEYGLYSDKEAIYLDLEDIRNKKGWGRSSVVAIIGK